MAAITAAVIAGVGTAATVGTQVAQAASTPTGPGRNPTISKLPEDPVSQAMRGYEARLAITNQGVQAPTFASALASAGPGGMDPNAMKMPITYPGMTPLQAAQLGFVGPKGQAIPYVSQAEATAPGASFTPEQSQYLAQQKAYQSRLAGQQPGPWASSVENLGQRLNRLNTRLGNVTQQAGDTPTPEEQARIDRIQGRIGRVTARQTAQVGGPLGSR